jgi:hypothetical protein
MGKVEHGVDELLQWHPDAESVEDADGDGHHEPIGETCPKLVGGQG